MLDYLITVAKSAERVKNETIRRLENHATTTTAIIIIIPLCRLLSHSRLTIDCI